MKDIWAFQAFLGSWSKDLLRWPSGVIGLTTDEKHVI